MTANVAKPEASVGWWIDALAIDPFDSKHVCYATGTTIWNTMDMTNADSGGDTHWTICADGIEEFCVANLISPPAGPHLISAVSDCGGFTHDDLDVSPAQGANLHPLFANSMCLDCAYMNPSVVVRTGVLPYHGPKEGTMGYSLDGGHNWKPFSFGAAAAGTGGAAAAAEAAGNHPVGGWIGLHGHGRDAADLHGPGRDVEGGDGPAGGALADRRPCQPQEVLRAGCRGAQDVFEHRRRGDVHRTPMQSPACRQPEAAASLPGAAAAGARGWSRWGGGRETFGLSGQALCHSTDGGRTFREIPNHPPIGARSSVAPLSFGKAAPGKDYPALFIVNQRGTNSPGAGIYRSDDEGATWVRINDPQHQWGRCDCLSGDPRIYGRVYVGTFGRGACLRRYRQVTRPRLERCKGQSV